MDDLEKLHEKKNIEIQEKYADIINEISCKYKVDVGVAFEMLKAVGRGADLGDDIVFDHAELQKDYDELEEISKKIHELKQ